MDTGRLKVFYADDDEIDRAAFKRLVHSDGLPYDYKLAMSVSEAVRILGSERFDIILLDLRLGDGTAFDIIPSITDTPFIIVTDSGDEGLAVKAMKKGASEYLIKDLDRHYLTLLPVTITKAIRHFSTEKELQETNLYIKTVLENIYSGVISIDENGTVHMVNHIAAHIFGYTAEEIINTHISKLIPLAFAVEDDRSVSEDLASEKVRIVDLGYDSVGVKKDGSEFPLAFNISEIWTRGRRTMSIALMDITERKRLEEQLQEQAQRDGLTGLYNRRALQTLFSEELARCRRYGRCFAVMMMDIDHFKNLNDTYGHQAGDEVLREVARLIKKTVRPVDKPVRYGGEEFTVILPETDKDAAEAVAERLRANIETNEFIAGNEDNQTLRIRSTVSIGVATFPEDGATMEKLISSADWALYKAKHSGRNCVVLSAPEHGGINEGQQPDIAH